MVVLSLLVNDVQESLARLRQKGWTLAAIADVVGARPNTVWRWLDGSRYPRNARAVVVMLDALEQRKRVPRRRRRP